MSEFKGPVTEVEGLDFYDFMGEQVRRDGVEFQGQRGSSYRIHTGTFQCSTCQKVLPPGSDVLPVWWEPGVNKPSNFVCMEDRGLLTKI